MKVKALADLLVEYKRYKKGEVFEAKEDLADTLLKYGFAEKAAEKAPEKKPRKKG